ncbi:crotonobetainyl-CoA:carnitine CoA-transferase CaiB-like acyl-CoA transferase [Branchiibius hedensis]|uniref:Crotonobetainyl-CoA:carnitine CoA-transferase CaiB n=1 Tax=Branchiibius hedensis TaxID=672460 RepID=A0A2Y8ZP18_9MICO|nr:CaiB/BaiF CoA-transferase family protein [Branchiibius hedensis]PWJ24859.1 crotonobetainyl-CoA:carnitine CoA-transferase CaiB-like acyl-CoA transferase [Branchiibius hedensis]SSA33675.1 Crotonobetainyl-CoA:carnitine CoA-transferase CaiB [Branchiibius hedensis]
MTLPLEGYTVIAVEQAVAAPLASRQLADLGARVIKVERPGDGDLARGYDHLVHGTGSHFVWLNRGKESLAVDLKDPAGRDVVGRLIAEADVFLQNLAPGAAARLGLDADTLRATKPELVVVNLSGYGAGGDMETRKAYDMLVQAEAGLVSITGTPAEAVKTGIPTADIASGMYCTQAVLAALLRRERTGEGATIEVTMFEATAEWMGHPMYVQLYADRQIPRMGLSHAAIAPYDAYPTIDGQVLIGIQSDSGWRTLATSVFGNDALASDSRFTTNVLRVENRAACDAAVAEHTSRWTTADLSARLAETGVPAAQVSSVRDLVEHPQLQARRRWRTVDTEGGQVQALLPPVTFQDVEAAMGDVPALGQHTLNLLAEAGISSADAHSLVQRGAATQHSNRQPQEALS